MTGQQAIGAVRMAADTAADERSAFIRRTYAHLAGAIALFAMLEAAMVALAGGFILYYTSNVLHHYRPDRHVAAALALFAAVALMFWYVVRLFLNRH